MMKILWKTLFLGCVLLLVLPACASVGGGSGEPLQASGVVEAVEVLVSPELGGRVAEVYVRAGAAVAAGDPLLRLEGDMLEAQRGQIAAALITAESNLALAQAGLVTARQGRESAALGVEAARLQLSMALDGARLAEQSARTIGWGELLPGDTDLPAWYFLQREQIAGAQSEVEASAASLEAERENLAAVLQGASGALLAAETRLSEALAAFLVAEDLVDRAAAQNASGEIEAYIEDLHASAEAELEAAQLAYDELLTDQGAEDVLEARARVAAAQERVDLARDRLSALQTGEFSPQVAAARLAVQQAESAEAVAAAGVVQAEAAVDLAAGAAAEAAAAVAALDVQMEKLIVEAPVSGVVLVRSVEPGEVVGPGTAVFSIGRLEQLTITVFIPEDRYGQVGLGDRASVYADSFPGRAFEAVVTRIADEAEFTPRNVQTQEERVMTVFAVELSLVEGAGELKPGMPADVDFDG